MMRVRFNIFLILLIKLINIVISNEILGCGGFIKSHADIDFSKVEIKLFTKQGSLKDKTDCSPSNGYYFLPVYDKGEYILKISPPPGWSFQPESVELNFNGKTDFCSQGKDVNFVFKGFGITGRVSLADGISGAKDVSVELKSSDGNDIRKTITDINGVFSFTPIIPGKYLIKASHSTWHFSKSEYTVDVSSGNTELPKNSLVVSGFNVNGRFDNIGQSYENIKMVLLKKDDEKKSVKEINQIKIDKSGQYTFEDVKPGRYIVKPFVTNPDLKLNIEPAQLEFQVVKDNIILQSSFEVTGFSVTGRVLAVENGSGISQATIYLNEREFAQTQKDGTYILKNIQPGTYNLKVTADNLEFTEKTVKLALPNPQIPDVIVSGFKVCGQIVSKKSYVIGITKFGSTFHTTTSTKSETGDWCTYLSSGKYSMEVLVTDEDKANGIQFFPVKQNVEVNISPIDGIIFSQLRASLSGEVQCLPDSLSNCKNMEVTLHSLDSMGKLTGQTATAIVQNGKYSFSDILPGPYEITIPESNLCFDTTRFFININSAVETVPTFKHIGYEISIISSHRTKMYYQLQQKSPSPSEKLVIGSGVNTFCVSKLGEYTFKLDGCHIYDPETLPKGFSTKDQNPVVLTALAHKIGIRVLSPESNSVNSLKLSIERKSASKELVSLISESHKVDGYHAYRYDMHLKQGESITITPQSSLFLFKPEYKEIIGGADCLDVAFNFIAVKGLIIQGKTQPSIKDAKITLNFPNNPEIASQETYSGSNGEFKFAPIDETLNYELAAEKESYVFSEYDKTIGIFKAHKLCDVIVSVKDEADQKLNGVLLSLSGAESYRKNLVTDESGTIKFHSLSPSEYFLRPMMKEYKFEPNSKMITVKDGDTVRVELIGKRIAYSVFGTVTSLNGDPFSNVALEAISDEKCMHHQEESTTENNGQYRIRGLQPGCSYNIQPKQDDSNGGNVERTIPERRTIEISNIDQHDVNLIAISPINFVDVIARVYTPSNEYYKTLRIQIYRKGSADSPIYSQRVESPLNTKIRYNPGIMVYFPRIPLDKKIYFVELKTSLSDKIYKYQLPVEQFLANTSAIYVELNFEPEIRTSESDLNQNSISALILVALVAIAFFKQELAMDLLNFVWTKLSSIGEDLLQKANARKKDTRNIETTINYKEIEQIAEGINSIKKKKTKKI